MRLTQLKFSGFRCYHQQEFTFDQRINVLHGANGSGKTSVLEAIYYLSTGKSFRSSRSRNLINHQADDLAVYARYLDDHQNTGDLGVSLNKQLKKKLKLNQQTINNQATLAHLMPVVSIDPDSYLFLDKPPKFRRTFLDWLVFHVKPEYLDVWGKASRCQQQLNQLYKNKNQQDLPYWESQYVQWANQLNALRKKVFNDLQDKVIEKIGAFIPELGHLEVRYHQGWSTESTLQEQLLHDADKNRLYGSLQHGVHKMDIRNHINNQLAQDCLSRGQKKLISIIYYLCFIELLTEECGVTPILCLDDMDAELDLEKTRILCDFIEHSNHQVFITTVDPSKLTSVLNDAAMFHVKHQ